MLRIEQKLYEQLCKLRDEYDLQGIKAEFEAEGSSFRDLMRLRRLTSKAGIKLFLKIGGVEAIRDIKDALEIDVDGLIAPMVESKFGAKKFYDSYKKIYGTYNIHTTLNIETIDSIKQINSILGYAKGRFDNITIGRSDLTASYFDKTIEADSDFIFKKIEEIGSKMNGSNLTMTVGGSLSVRTIDAIDKHYQGLKDNIYKLETRKIILATSTFINKRDAISEALKFEEIYILSKQEFSDIHIGSDISRLTELKRRL